MSGEKENLLFNKKIKITDNMESLGFFNLGNFSKQYKYVKYVGNVFSNSKPFYIKFPRLINNKIIPYYTTYDQFYFHVDLYWTSNPIFITTYLDRKVEILLFMTDITDIETLKFYIYDIAYDNKKMLDSIKGFINDKITTYGWSFDKYDTYKYHTLPKNT